MKANLISVLMCAYNDANTISATIDSVLKQIDVSFELIIVDDGSTDDTHDIITKYAKRYEFIKVYRKENSGLADSLNYGLNFCHGEYIARLDADDLCHPERLKFQSDYLKKNDVQIVGSSVTLFGEANGKLTPPIFDKDIKAKLFFEPALIHPTVMLCNTVFEDIRYTKDILLAQDYYLWVNLTLAGFQFHNLKKSLLSYRLSNTNVTHSRRLEQVKFGNISRSLYLREMGVHLTTEQERTYHVLCTGFVIDKGRDLSWIDLLKVFRVYFKILFLPKRSFNKLFFTKCFIRKVLARGRSLCLK